MEKQTKTPFIIIIVLLSVAIVGLILQPPTSLIDTFSPFMTLPDKLDGYIVDNILFCQNEACMSSCLSKEATGNTCPTCSGALDVMSVGEKRLLTEDTTLERKIYHKLGGEKYVVSIVTSGRERTSIHTPQTCLLGQGYNILDQYLMKVVLVDRKPLKVMALDLRKTSPSTHKVQHFTYTYWFVSRDHETPYHIERLLLMASDNLFRGISHRWAYVSILTVTDGTDSYKSGLDTFIKEIHPKIIVKQEGT